MKSVTIPYRQENHGDFDAEWPVQRKVTGWWNITGLFSDPAGPACLYSYGTGFYLAQLPCLRLFEQVCYPKILSIKEQQFICFHPKFPIRIPRLGTFWRVFDMGDQTLAKSNGC